MSIRAFEFKEEYRSGYDDIVEDFFQPALSRSKQYWRAVGYFSSSALEAFGSPLGKFIRNGGHIRLVTSVELSATDLKAIENGASRENICAQRLEQIIESDFADSVGEGVVRLARLLEIGRLEILIAVPKRGTGIYHEKIGLFLNGKDFIAFTGSSNESRNAFENNRECVDVYTSWDTSKRAERKKKHFEAIWSRTDKGLEVYSFPQAAQKKLLRVCSEQKTRQWEKQEYEKNQEQRDKKWQHQEEAVAAFFAHERGILNMATGTGKTRTALKILQTLFNRGAIESVIVCADGNDLLDQWYNELLISRKSVGHDLRIYQQYKNFKELQSFTLHPEKAVLLVSRMHAAPALRELSLEKTRRTLLIHDEVHRLGSPGNREKLSGLSDNVRFRLGLSATPDREYDQEGNAFIEKHIGPVLMTFGLRKAIQRGVLAPFNYYPLSFELTDSDRGRINSVYIKRAAREADGNPMSDADLWISIAHVYKTSEAKIPIFAEFIAKRPDLLKRCIIFTETIEYSKSVLEIVHRYLPDFHTYFSGEDAETLRKFAHGELECLITCHRLSEGIDIHSLNTVILFSSERARLETIQRIGRCLRTNPNNPEKKANIVDFIREGHNDNDPTADEKRRDWLEDLAKVSAVERKYGY